jgi:hypothetical protein
VPVSVSAANALKQLVAKSVWKMSGENSSFEINIDEFCLLCFFFAKSYIQNVLNYRWVVC